MLTRITVSLLLLAIAGLSFFFWYQYGGNLDSMISVWRGYSDFDSVVRVTTGFVIFVVVARILAGS